MASAAQSIEIAVIGAHITDGAKFSSWQSAILEKTDIKRKERELDGVCHDVHNGRIDAVGGGM
ncbi:hypothetical protein GT2_19_00460 [Parageobacillus thermoglucosidasius NBRC 107763]|nr:hypothetical protein GT2_19_00460 [Parageobacillus thermoglucosidasius NBRC 107763]